MNLDTLLRALEKVDVKYAELRYEKIISENIEMNNGELENIFEGTDEGIGIRVFHSGGWGFTSITSPKLEDIVSAIEKAKRMAISVSSKLPEKDELPEDKDFRGNFKDLYGRNPMDVSYEEKISDLREIDSILSVEEEIKMRNVRYYMNYSKKFLVNTSGSELSHEVMRTYLAIGAMALSEGKRSAYRGRVGKIGGYEVIEDAFAESEYVVEKTMTLLNASAVKGGRYPVILDQELAGVFIHEAVGHACEADLVISGQSILAGKIGERIGSELLTVYDDPTHNEGFGKIPFDDEGSEAKKKLLIENGILRNYILSKETAAKLKMENNGGARAESFLHPPIVRMSNTYIANGDMSFEELLEGISYGIYLKDSRGGQVDTATGTFMFNAQEAYEIVNGEIGKPLKDVSLSGSTLEILHGIEGVGNDFSMGIGFCGKGQTVPVGHGSPHIRVKEAIVGGR